MGTRTMIDISGFAPRSQGQALRVLQVLETMSQDENLRESYALHGGTALNLFFLNAPRLSVDADLSYVRTVDSSVMEKDRPDLERRLFEVAHGAGFDPRRKKLEHSGGAINLLYRDGPRQGHVKVDLNYRNRSPLLPPQTVTADVVNGPSVTYKINHPYQLFGGKMKAVLGRVAARDLYDINLIGDVLDPYRSPLVSRILTYSQATSDSFPRQVAVASRFGHRQDLVDQDLVPMLPLGTEVSLDQMISGAESFFDNHFSGMSDAEREFIDLAKTGDYRPEILFSDEPDVLAAALADPVLHRKQEQLLIGIGMGRVDTSVNPIRPLRQFAPEPTYTPAQSHSSNTCGSTATISGNPCRRKGNCPYHG